MTGPTRPATPAPTSRPAWWPTEGDLGAMVGLTRCDGRGTPQPCSGGSADTEDEGPAPAPTALAARLSGLLRTGC